MKICTIRTLQLATVSLEIVFHSILVLVKELQPLTLEDEADAELPLPPPMFKENYHSSSSQCWFKSNFKTVVNESVC